MVHCDVVIAGGGPAGSACAWKLTNAGLDVVVLDGARFPRDKVCAGWITPQVVADLGLDTESYQQGRTFQPITGFRTGIVGGADELVDTEYGRTVSFGIRRCEFDDYLLRRSGARLDLGSAVTTLRRDGSEWVVNDAFRTPMVVGAGGYFCPVARQLNGSHLSGPDSRPVVAQEAEVLVDPGEAASLTVSAETPALYFCQDLKGYGWCFRKGKYLNVGLGRLDCQSLPRAMREFAGFLIRTRAIPDRRSWTWRGHAYWVYPSPRMRISDAGVLLVGDAAGLAYPQSGEGIRPAVESGLLAALTILESRGDYSAARLSAYDVRIRTRFDAGRLSRALARFVPPGLGEAVAGRLLRSPQFVRHVVLDRWFLHMHQPPLALAAR